MASSTTRHGIGVPHDFPDDAPDDNGATHIGMFMTWTIERGLFVDPDLTPREVEEIEAVRVGSMSARDFLLENFDGKLCSDCFTTQAAAFADRHYDDFLADFQRLLYAAFTLKLLRRRQSRELRDHGSSAR